MDLRILHRRGFVQIKDFLVEKAGFVQSTEDKCLFSFDSEEGTILLGIHVDDMIVSGTPEVVQRFRTQIR